jgi:hypothetical protein
MKRLGSMIFFALILLPAAAGAQVKIYKWDDVLCSFKGTYNPAKISLKTIEDTKKLVDFGMGLPLQTDQTVFDPKDLPGLDVDALDAEYRDTLKMLEGLKPADTEYFRSLKNKHIATLKKSYELKRVTLLAHTDPESLRDVSSSQEVCFEKWGLPVIAGGEVLANAWKALLEEQKKVNGAPDRLEARFVERYNSPDRMKWALVEVLGFGWWNCVNRSIPYVENDGTAEDEFKKLFVKVETVECEEPE